jgi:hypothetical protein
MTAEQSRAAAQDRQQNLAVLSGDPALTLFQEGLSCTADDVGHLQWRPVHTLWVRAPGSLMVSASRGLAVALRCLLDRCR